MQVQAISNQNFQGSVTFSKDISPKLVGYLSEVSEKSGIAKKPYNLQVQNTKDKRFLSIEAINPENLTEKYTVLVHKFLQKKDILHSAVKDAMSNFEKSQSLPQKNLNKVI